MTNREYGCVSSANEEANGAHASTKVRAHLKAFHLAAAVSAREARDPNGLYRKTRTGEIPTFTGISVPFEVPKARLDTRELSSEANLQQLVDVVSPRLMA